MLKQQYRIPVFYATDENYLPFLAVSIRSLIDNLSLNSACDIFVLHHGLCTAGASRLLEMQTENVRIRLVDVGSKLAPLVKKLNLRDYYTASIYFRLFIPSLFPNFCKAIYIDADTVLNEDISKLYSIPLGDHLVGAVSDDIIASHEDFRRYAEDGLGIPYREYFNSGVMLMNLEQFRSEKIEDRFVYLLNRYQFDTVCPDQDYLNVLCRDRVLYLDKGWNKMSIDCNYDGVPMLVHYNMFYKPWQYDDISYGAYFWEYARRTDFYEELLRIRSQFGERDRQAQADAHRMLHINTARICEADNNFRRVMPTVDFSEDGEWLQVYEA